MLQNYGMLLIFMLTINLFYNFIAFFFLELLTGKILTGKEPGKIEALRKKNVSIKSISEELKSFRHIIQNFLERPYC